MDSNANAETIAKLKKEIDFSKILKSVIELKGDKEFFKFQCKFISIMNFLLKQLIL
nr:hypothetical protein [Mycoplasmopsis bovis]